MLGSMAGEDDPLEAALRGERRHMRGILAATIVAGLCAAGDYFVVRWLDSDVWNPGPYGAHGVGQSIMLVLGVEVLIVIATYLLFAKGKKAAAELFD
jgi:hypothetical protein